MPTRSLWPIAGACFCLAGVCSATGRAAEPPADNPVAALYSGPEGYPAWTDALAWPRVLDMKAYAKGKNDFEKFENARDELAAQGGGVLYYPAGTYDFSQGPFDGPQGRGLMLKKGVLLRGETPAAFNIHTPAAEMKADRLVLRTKFIFGFKDRSPVALQAGDRVRLVLAKALVGTDARGNPWSDDVYLSIGVKDGKLNGADLFVSGRVEQAKCQGKWTEAGNKVTVDVQVEMAGKGTRGQYQATFGRHGTACAGTFIGKYDGQDVKGEVSGQQYNLVAETPRDWNLVGLCPEPGKGVKDVDCVGICYVHLVGATVYFGPQMTWGETWQKAQGWRSDGAKPAWAGRKPDGTHPYDPFMAVSQTDPKGKYEGAGKGRLVCGCVFERAALTNDFETAGRKENPAAKDGMGLEGFHMAKFAGRVSVYGSRVLIAANSLLMSPTANFKYEQASVRAWPTGHNNYKVGEPRRSIILWDYGRVMGLDVNKDLLGLVGAELRASGVGGYHEEGVAVLDNFVFNNGHKGFNLSGRWGVFRNNRNERTFLRGGQDPYFVGGWRLSLDGYLESAAGGPGMISDNLARAFDLGGAGLWVEGNSYINTGSDPGNDGEGIVCQLHGGTSINSWAVTHNVGSGRGSGKGYILAWAVPCHGFLIGWNETTAEVGVTGGQEVDAMYVANKCTKVSGKGGQDLPTGLPVAPKDVKAEPYQGDAVKITWTDAAQNEVAFRVERQIEGGPWTTIAYRPPRKEGSEDNPQAWVDFLAPTGKKLVYRVVAVSAEDKGGASPATAAVVLRKP